MNTTPAAFTRSPLTWQAYAMLAFIGFSQAILSPLMPFLRSELALNYTLGGLLPAAIACGLIFTGLFAGNLTRYIDRRILFWGGGAGLALSVGALTISLHFTSVFLSILFLGISGSLAQVMIQAILSDEHGENRAIALTESNVAASLSGTLTPLVLGALQYAGLSWRAISIVTFLLISLIAIRFWKIPIPNSKRHLPGEETHGSLPLSFWLYWCVLFLMVSAEMSLAVWSTDFLISVAGLSRANAVLAFGVFPASMLAGRFAGSFLTRRVSNLRLLVSSLCLSLLGLFVFWLSSNPILNILGLSITGLGIANQYPLTMSLAVGTAGPKTNQASARITLAVGIALLVAPIILGTIADRLGLRSAFIIVPALITLALFASFWNSRHTNNTQINQPA